MIISIIAAGLTAIGTSVTLWQASKVKKYRSQIAFDLRKIHLSEISDLLKKAQDECRRLLREVHQLNRGRSMLTVVDLIQSYIDKSVNLIHLSGPDSDVRSQIKNIQTKLREFQNATDPNIRKQFVYEMHELIQDSISMCKERKSSIDFGD